MCGIAGVLTFKENARSHADAISTMTSMMRRRGPDDEGYWHDDNLYLGFRRLSIIDLSVNGKQPMHSEDGRYVIVFNGECYNFGELRSELEKKGIRFLSSGDTEVVLKSIAYWGVDALSKFNGMFALAFYDKAKKELILARDPVGIKPLFYLLHSNGVVFASQYNQLLQHHYCDRNKIDESVLKLYLSLHYIPEPFGLLRNTFKLEKGHYLKVSNDGKILNSKFYELPVFPASTIKGERALDVLEDEIRRAVKRQLVSDVPVGSFLSGGIDSLLVTYFMNERSPDPHLAFTIGSNSKFDESAIAKGYADFMNLPQKVHLINDSDILAMSDNIGEAYGEPFADFSALPTMLISKIASQYVKVALSGDGGDEMFFGYERQWRVLRHNNFFVFPLLVRKMIWAIDRLYSHNKYIKDYILEDTLGKAYFGLHSRFRNKDLDLICPGLRDVRLPCRFDLYNSKRTMNNKEAAEWIRKTEFDGMLQRVLAKVDNASMFYSLEVRVPLLDLKVLETAAKIDYRENIGNDQGKQVLKRILARHIPMNLINVKKMGFSIPLEEWMRKELRPFVEEYLFSGNIFLPELFDIGKIKEYYNEHCSGLRDRKWILWTLLCLQVWARNNMAIKKYE